MTSPQPTDLFSRSWSLYDLITEYNYMFHHEIYAEISHMLSQRRDHGEYRMLDLGCGNARFLAPVLLQFPPAHYQGVDLSEDALGEARDYLADLPDVELKHGDLLEAIHATTDKWDVIFTGYALHHLSADEKAAFFQAAARCLPADGWLLMVDVVREEGESREAYLRGYLKFMRESWTKVPEEQLEEACGHVASHDYPETLSALNAMTRAAGLGEGQTISRHGPHYTVLFSGG